MSRLQFDHLFGQLSEFSLWLRAANLALRGHRNRPDAARFFYRLEENLLALRDEVLHGTFAPGSYYQFTIFEPKERVISAAPFRERVLHHALCQIFEPCLERISYEHSYACRKGKGLHLALRNAQRASRRWPFYLKLDVQKYFNTVDHDLLLASLRGRFLDGDFCDLFERIVRHQVPGLPLGKGLPIGNLTSQHLANFNLTPLDHFIRCELKLRHFRYMDDFLIFGSNRSELRQAEEAIASFLMTHCKQVFKESARRLGPTMAGFTFLGFRVFPHHLKMKAENLKRFRRKMRAREAAFERGRLDEVSFALSLRGLLNYAQPL
jgi:RNA-directed DNA polymerase